jgi:hypothetical protein
MATHTIPSLCIYTVIHLPFLLYSPSRPPHPRRRRTARAVITARRRGRRRRRARREQSERH